jgi:hypothetical protein
MWRGNRFDKVVSPPQWTNATAEFKTLHVSWAWAFIAQVKDCRTIVEIPIERQSYRCTRLMWSRWTFASLVGDISGRRRTKS